MKTKLWLTTLAFFAFATRGHSQGHVPAFQLGVKGGVNISKVDGDAFANEFRYGYHAGAFAIVKLSDHVQIQPELLFSQNNTRIDSSFGNVFHVSNMKDISLNYLTIPLLLNLSPGKIISFQVGPQFGILMNQHQTLFENGKNAFSNGDFSMVGGVQLNLAWIKLSGRYMVGLNNINDVTNNSKWKNQGFQLSAGFRII
jgi:hypothetical protein